MHVGAARRCSAVSHLDLRKVHGVQVRDHVLADPGRRSAMKSDLRTIYAESLYDRSNCPTCLGDLAGRLETDALVRSGNQGHFLCRLHVFLFSLII